MTELAVVLQVYIFHEEEAMDDDLPIDANFKILRDYAKKLEQDKERAQSVLDQFKPIDTNCVKWGTRHSLIVYNAFL